MKRLTVLLTFLLLLIPLTAVCASAVGDTCPDAPVPFSDFARTLGYYLNTLSVIAVLGMIVFLSVIYRRFRRRRDGLK